MIVVIHPTPQPPALAAEYAANPSPADPDVAWGGFPGKQEIRTALEPVQQGLCAYCEESLAIHGFHIDHVVPKSRDASGTFRFDNLVLSCIRAEELGTIIGGSSCGHFRGNIYDPVLLIKPTEPDCWVYFFCRPTGELLPAAGLDPSRAARAEYMIRELNLNCTRLNRRRRDWLLAVDKQIAAVSGDREAAHYLLEYCLGHGQPFASVVRDYFGTP